MKSSCLVKTLLLISTTALIVQADIAPANSFLVPRTVTVINTEDFPDRVFLALEFFPGRRDVPVAITKMEPGVEARITGYKLDLMFLYSAKATYWQQLMAASNHPPVSNVNMDQLSRVDGDMEANSQWEPNYSTLKSELLKYRLEGVDGSKLTRYGTLLTYMDGTKKELLANSMKTHVPGKISLNTELKVNAGTLRWIPLQSGVASVSIFNSHGRRIWISEQSVTAQKAQTVSMPDLTKGHYLISVQCKGRTASAWLETGKR